MRAWIFATYVAAYAVLNAGGLLLLRTALGSGTRRAGGGVGALIVDPRFFIGSVLYGLGFLMWVGTLTRYQLSTVYPVFVGVSYCSVVVAAFLLLHEQPSPAKLVGISLVALGLLLVVR